MIFLFVVITVSLGMNWYVLARLCDLWAIGSHRWFYAAPPALVVSCVAALVLESRVSTLLIDAFYTLAMAWLGLCWLLLGILLVQQLLSQLIVLPRHVWALGVCGLGAALALYAGVNARAIAVRREHIPQLPLRVAQLSDIHIGSIGAATLGRIVAKTNDLEPDLILITGDLFDNANSATRAAAALLAGFTAPVLFTSGNHEAYTGYERVRELLAGTSIRWLRNETTEVKGVRVIGVDNSYGTELLRSILARARPSSGFTILMNHQPIGFDIAGRHGVHLMLSGHLHSGQIWPFNYLVGLAYPYLNGLHEAGGAFLNVSTGTGIWGPPMRLGSRSEIVLLEPLAGDSRPPAMGHGRPTPPTFSAHGP